MHTSSKHSHSKLVGKQTLAMTTENNPNHMPTHTMLRVNAVKTSAGHASASNRCACAELMCHDLHHRRHEQPLHNTQQVCKPNFILAGALQHNILALYLPFSGQNCTHSTHL
jgi:hypothetical protein